MREETGLTLTDFQYRGIITFVQNGADTEYMHLFRATGWTGGMRTDCEEGELAWIGKEDLLALPIWEGDKIFLRLMDADRPFFSLKLNYAGDVLTGAVLDGRQLDI